MKIAASSGEGEIMYDLGVLGSGGVTSINMTGISTLTRLNFPVVSVRYNLSKSGHHALRHLSRS